MDVIDRSSRYWKVVPIIDPDTGEHSQQYFFRRVRAKRIPIKSPLARQMAGYVLIERDLRMVMQWLSTIDRMSGPPKNQNQYAWTDKDDESHNRTLGLFVAALIFYGKCFSQCEGRRIRLDVDWIPQGFEETHKLVLMMRNNFAAHSGAEKFEDVNVVLVVPEKKGRLRDRLRLYREMKQPEALISHKDDEFSFFLLASKLREKVLEKLEELNRKIFQEEINPRGMKYWLAQERY